MCVVGATVSVMFRFKNPYKMADHGSSHNGLNSADGLIDYKVLRTFIAEAVVSFANPYAFGVSKFTFHAGLTARPIRNLKDLECPPHISFNHKRCSTLPWHKFPTFVCATKTAHSLYDWLMYCLQKKNYVLYRFDITSRTNEYVAALQKPGRACPTSFCSLPLRSLLVDKNYNLPHKRKRALEQLLPVASSDICPYWPARPPFGP